jgi:hypothetical protein
MMNHGVAGLLESTFCVPYSVTKSYSALPALGFYPKILGFFEAVGIFLGFYFEK